MKISCEFRSIESRFDETRFGQLVYTDIIQKSRTELILLGYDAIDSFVLFL